ncbi:TIGR02450 family Trp-rich protein [Synechococcus sp. HK01-R]|jgi:tryptophan-rich hypothetical protein|uniref:TIGR02450 family Trp-rich protein n=2 Tax=unclassified Synechococcus TaxID=2626047 RepID=UPI002104354E|nr:TIGR02450 family Trp-rich protein [Synechococcus sp. HK01-R]
MGGTWWPPMPARLSQAWTSSSAREGYRHFRLILQGGRGNERWVELEPLLQRGLRLRVTCQELKDSSQWLSGWQPLPPSDD